ncbi:cation diffusion facilitator family transporter [Zavarzinia aquatilis]|uniref:Cation-efflux pump FieF n=1 Tax=Zavarzinia aquatilis TaxID=2211142 RepID=A0A317EHJ1_9PROT|nr:cation diffusion facilitator family transporter [Zavarzinia aquatilis]PWR24675.1 divalent metal cation transporter FieF [Zavarzinia aquatilis]
MSSSPAVAAPAAEPLDVADAARLMRRATMASVGVALTLIAIKIAAYVLSGSVAMLSSLVDSSLDAAASLATLFAVHQSTAPADREHRFGHGKAEALAGLLQAAIVSGSGMFLLFESVRRILNPAPIDNGLIGIGVMVISIVLTLGLVTYQQRVARRTGSIAVSGDRLHYLSDLLSNAGVILALVLASQFGLVEADGIIALGIAGILLHGAYGIVRGALDMLMDRELPDVERARIIEIVKAEPRVLALHDLRTRRSGLATFIQLHLVLDADMKLRDAHGIAEAVEQALITAFPGAEVIIHEDPDGVEESDGHARRI